MDSERRHDLETNDLREFLDNFKDFWDKHGNKILLVLFIGLGSYTLFNLYSNYQVKQANAGNEALEAATTADTLRAVAEEHEAVRDEALRRAADILLADSRDARIEGNDDDAKDALKTADAAYMALAERGKTVPYQLVGYEGMAKVAEMRGAWDKAQWDKAAAHYKKVIDLSGEIYLFQAERAQAGLDRMELLKNPVAFAPAPEPRATPEPGSGLDGLNTPLLEGLDLPDLGQPVTPVPAVQPPATTEPAPTEVAPAPAE